MKLGDLFIKLGLKSQEFEKGIDKAKGNLNNFGGFVKKVGGLIGIAFGVQQLVSFGKELFNMSGQLAGIEDAFKRIGTSKDLDNLRRATSGTVNDLELMRQAVMASNFGIPVKQLGSLLEFASKRAQDTGQSVDYLVNSIVVGIGRKSPLILDNLGISAIQLKEKLGAIGLEAASVGDVARAVGEIAAESMAKSGKLLDTNAVKVAQVKTAWDNFKLSLAAVIAESDNIAGFFDMLTKQINMLPQNLAISGRALTKVFGSLWGAKSKEEIQRGLDDINAGIEKFLAEQDALNKKVDEGGKVTEEYVETLADLRTALTAAQTARESMATSDEKGITTINREIKALEEKIKRLEQLGTLQARVAQREVSAIPFTPINATKVERNKEYSWLDAPGIDMSLSDIKEKMKQTDELLAQYREDWLNDWGGFQVELGQTIDAIITDSIYALAEAFGELAAGDVNLKGFFNNILSQIGGFAKQLGGMLIAYGVAQLAFGQSLANFFNPASAGVLIAAGAALVAVGGAIQSATRAKAGGGGGGTGMFNQEYNINVAAAGGGTSGPQLFLKGDDIYWSQQRNDYKRGAIG